MNIIAELYYGRVEPQMSNIINDDRIADLTNIVSENTQALNDMLNEKEKELFTALTEASSELLSLSEMEFFVNGWKLCAKFMLDTFSKP